MGLGRWRWEGDEFVHHTEEELAEEAFGKALLVMAVCAVLGPVLIFYNLDTKGDLFYVGCGASLIGLYGLLRYTKAIIVGIIIIAAIGGLFYYFLCSSENEQKGSENPKSETVEEVASNSNYVSSAYSGNQDISSDANYMVEEVVAVEEPIDEVAAEEVITEEIADDDEIRVMTDQMPTPPFAYGPDYISEHLRYPMEAKENGIQGTVVVEFVVEKDGTLSNARIMKSDDESLNEEALRLINDMPTWKPGRERGKLVRVKCVMPIKFSL